MHFLCTFYASSSFVTESASVKDLTEWTKIEHKSQMHIDKSIVPGSKEYKSM